MKTNSNEALWIETNKHDYFSSKAVGEAAKDYTTKHNAKKIGSC